ncbi:MAG: hypothetical protein DRJ07_11395 [Bacteroidetes bacterium]|nr:MAG: hypothetical protein DRJ07_11395 [Bacteroidota bacterium]
MKKIFFIIGFITSFLILSCTSNDVKEISGTLLFNEIGTHSFNINAENIQATITIAAPNKGEVQVIENVNLYRTVDYTAKINDKSISASKSELLSNLVVLYKVKSGNEITSNLDNGYIKIDWKGFY